VLRPDTRLLVIRERLGTEPMSAELFETTFGDLPTDAEGEVAQDPGGPRFAVRVDDAVLEEDLAHATAAGRGAIARAMNRFAREGVPAAWLKRCQTQHRDGTDLSGCLRARRA